MRGTEVVDLLVALNTGHEGGCATLHANSAGDVPARLEALAALAGMDRAALHSQLASGLRVAVHLDRDLAGRRRVAQLSLLSRDADGEGLVRAVPAWTWDGVAAAGVTGTGWRELADLLG